MEDEKMVRKLVMMGGLAAVVGITSGCGVFDPKIKESKENGKQCYSILKEGDSSWTYQQLCVPKPFEQDNTMSGNFTMYIERDDKGHGCYWIEGSRQNGEITFDFVTHKALNDTKCSKTDFRELGPGTHLNTGKSLTKKTFDYVIKKKSKK